MISFIQFLLLLVAFNYPTKTHDINDKIFRVYFEQENRIIEVGNDEIYLKKEPFDIVLELPEPMGVLVHASLNPETYDLAIVSKPLKKLPGFDGTGMAEGVFNADHEIMLSNIAPNYWFYDSDTAHRFDNVTMSNGKIICKRHVAQLNDVDSSQVIQITDITAPLNLVFMSTEWTEDFKEQIELNRVSVRINWDD